MEERMMKRIYVKCQMLFSEEPNWDALCIGTKKFKEYRKGKFSFKRSMILEDGTYCLPVYIDGRLNRFKYEDRNRIELTDEEAHIEFYEKTRAEIEDFFGCHVEFTELIGDYMHPDDLEEIAEAFSEERASFFAPRTELQPSDLMPEDVARANELAPFEELESLIGLDSVKQQVRDLARLVNEFGKDNLPCLHMVFRGNPGTGKTTVARIIAKIFDEAGITDGKGNFVETDRAGLVGQYVGHTAIKTQKVISNAKGGTLFIDEAYSLAIYDSDRDYGSEAIATLVKALEDERDEFVCIMAGYPKEMEALISKNPGLHDRIGFYIDFPDYNSSELFEVFERFAKLDGYKLSTGVKQRMTAIMDAIVKSKPTDFSNARLVRKIFERVRMDHLLKVGGKTFKVESIERVFKSSDMAQLLEGNKSVSVGFAAA